MLWFSAPQSINEKNPIAKFTDFFFRFDDKDCSNKTKENPCDKQFVLRQNACIYDFFSC
jgi:hypothetical protein